MPLWNLNITALELSYVRLSSTDILGLVSTFGATAKILQISQVASADGKWRDVFEAIRALKLEQFHYERLCTLLRAEDLYSQSNDLYPLGGLDETFSKALRGEHGVEHCYIKSERATMKVRKAVEVGLNLIIERLGSV